MIVELHKRIELKYKMVFFMVIKMMKNNIIVLDNNKKHIILISQTKLIIHFLKIKYN